jgi:hypothetical protein
VQISYLFPFIVPQIVPGNVPLVAKSCRACWLTASAISIGGTINSAR